VADVTDVSLPLWVVALLVVGALGPFVALAGHGSIAWFAIRRFFDRVSARIRKVEDLANRVGQATDDARAEMISRVDSVTLALRTDVMEVRTEILSRVDQIAGSVVPPNLDALRAQLFADLQQELTKAVSAIGESIHMNMLAAKSARVREVDSVLDDVMMEDPRARALVETLGKRRGKRAARVLESLQEIQAEEAEGHSVLGAALKRVKPPG
jgi:hypothetical protein